MAYVAGLIIVSLLFLSLHYFTELDKKQKILVSGIILAIIIGAIAFNNYNNAQQEKMLNAVLKFKQGKTIKCNGIKIDKKNYTLSIGTYTFIGKENTPHYAEMVSASTCK
ncbi:MAG: hypothetical protein GXO30_02525 [Epsilonproteobacteria bacterium]|nr:hypothetical protein [Campylobacterota bacterium]